MSSPIFNSQMLIWSELLIINPQSENSWQHYDLWIVSLLAYRKSISLVLIFFRLLFFRSLLLGFSSLFYYLPFLLPWISTFFSVSSSFLPFAYEGKSLVPKWKASIYYFNAWIYFAAPQSALCRYICDVVLNLPFKKHSQRIVAFTFRYLLCYILLQHVPWYNDVLKS